MAHHAFRRISIGFRLLGLGLIAATTIVPARGQTIPEPTREQLLNRLTVLFWQRPGDSNVLLKLRINSGAAFDLLGKGGMMALLSDALFPDPTAHEYVTEELGGRLEIATDYDAINITISGKATDFERITDLLRGALITPPLPAENVGRLREAKIKQLRERPPSVSEVADRAIATRLFGNFPYGHPATGSPETLARVERADLLRARERFLNADNATVVVIGGVERSRALRALRQLLGPWRKSDSVVPATFRQPDAPDSRTLVVNQNGPANAEIRLAVRGLARGDRDYWAAGLLALIVRDRWQAALPGSSIFVRDEVHALPGTFLMGASVPAASAPNVISAARDVMRSVINTPPPVSEVERARSETIGELSRKIMGPESFADAWLDIETYKLPPFSEQVGRLRSLTTADVQRAAARLFKDAKVASVVAGDYSQFKAGLGSAVELIGEAPSKTAPVSLMPLTKP